MPIQMIRDQFPDYAKDTKLNLGKLVSGDEVEGSRLTKPMVSPLLQSMYATKHPDVIAAVSEQVIDTLSDEEMNAAAQALVIESIHQSNKAAAAA